MRIALVVSSRATCPRRQVGCVIINNFNHIIATGYNGVPKNYPHCIDKACGGQNQKSSEGLNLCMATHAEQNALLQCSNTNDIKTIYCTTFPCITCAKLIANTSCKEIVYNEFYNDNNSALGIFNNSGIKVIHERVANREQSL